MVFVLRAKRPPHNVYYFTIPPDLNMCKQTVIIHLVYESISLYRILVRYHHIDKIEQPLTQHVRDQYANKEPNRYNTIQ